MFIGVVGECLVIGMEIFQLLVSKGVKESEIVVEVSSGEKVNVRVCVKSKGNDDMCVCFFVGEFFVIVISVGVFFYVLQCNRLIVVSNSKYFMVRRQS